MVPAITDSSYLRNLVLGLAFALTSATLAAPLSVQALPVEIIPIPSVYEFPKGGDAFYEGKLRPEFSAINDQGLAVGTELSSDRNMIGIVLWDVINKKERGTALLNLSPTIPPDRSPFVYIRSSLSSDGQILILAEAYYENPVKLLAFRGPIDALVPVDLPVTDFASYTLSSSSITGERLVTFEQYSLNGSKLFSGYWISPTSNFIPASLTLSLENRVPANDSHYFIDAETNITSQAPGLLFRVFDRTGISQRLSFTSTGNPIGISPDLTVLEERDKKLILQSLSKNTKAISVPGLFSRVDDAKSLPGMGFAVSGYRGQESSALFINEEGKVIDANCITPEKEATDRPINQQEDEISIAEFLAANSSHYLAKGYSSEGSQSEPFYNFLVRPDFNQKFENYCSQIAVKPLRSCAALYDKGSNLGSFFLKSGAKIDNTCQFEVTYSKLSNKSRIPGKVIISGYKGGKYKSREVSIPTGKGILTLSPKEFSSVNLSVVPLKKRSPFKSSRAYISLKN